MQSDDEDLDGKVCLITGSTSGLGLHTAKALYNRGATVILTCRDEVKGRKAVEEVIAGKKMASNKVHLFTLDLSCYRSIHKFSCEVKKSMLHIDILINNAGIYGVPFELSSYGIESQFATNCFGHFVLTNQLIPLLEESLEPRIVIISSGYYSGVKTIPRMKQLMGEETWDYQSGSAYALSKLANCLHAVALNKKLENTKSRISVYVLRPGFVRGTELGRETHWLLRAFTYPLIFFIAKSLNEGIKTITYCATEDKENLKSGSMYSDCNVEEFSPMVTEENATMMWNMLEEMETLVLQRSRDISNEEKKEIEKVRFPTAVNPL